MHRGYHTIVLSGATALRALRRERRISGGCSWNLVDLDEQTEALSRSTCLAGLIDLDDFRRAGILEDGEELDVAISLAAKRTPTPPVRAHGMSNLAEGGMVRISQNVYTLSPAALLLDLAPSLTFEELLALEEEFCGHWSLPERSLEPEDIAESLDFLGKPCGYYESEPVLDTEELSSYHAAAVHARGRKAAEPMVRHAVGGSRSPMEAIMNCVYALPHKFGGLNCGPIKSNFKIRLDKAARAISGLPYALADAYLPRFNTILEYNGSYHDDASVRQRDEARTLGLMSMGFDVHRLNGDQLRDADVLESIARLIYRRSGKHYRPRSKGYEKKRKQLLEGLRSALGLDRRFPLLRVDENE